MGTRPKRPGRAARDIHARIRAQADALHGAPRYGLLDSDALPELAELMDSARRKIEGTIPSTFEHAGRTYYLRVRLMLGVSIFDSPSVGTPLIEGLAGSSDAFGHAPGH